MADIQRRRLGVELRRLREAAGYTQEAAAELLDRDQGAISRIELGQRRIRQRELAQLLDAYGVTDPKLREQLTELARAGRERPWYAPYVSSLSHNYASYIGFESEATEIHCWESALIPGAVQTEQYALEVIRGLGRGLDEEEVQRRVTVRMKRQEQIAKTRPQLWVIMWEPALRVGKPDTLRNQLEHLLELAAEPRITFQVVPLATGFHPGLHLGSMHILRFRPPDDEVIYLETAVGEIYPTGEMADVCRLSYDYLRAYALDPKSSLDVIDRIRRDI